MLVTETAWGKRIKTDVLILGTGASGVGAALRAAELKADVLMVGQGRLESSGCLGGCLLYTSGGRHDICAMPRVNPVLEAMAALTVADALLLQRRMG